MFGVSGLVCVRIGREDDLGIMRFGREDELGIRSCWGVGEVLAGVLGMNVLRGRS